MPWRQRRAFTQRQGSDIRNILIWILLFRNIWWKKYRKILTEVSQAVFFISPRMQQAPDSMPGRCGMLGTDIFAHLYEKEDFYEKVVETYEEQALPYLEYLLKEGIDDLVSLSRQSAKLDSIRWENLENRYQYYDNDIRYLKYFIEKRVEFLNQVWLLGETYHNVVFTMDEEPWQIACVKDGETAGEEPIPYRYDKASLFIGWVTKEGVPYDKYKPVYEDMVFYPLWHELGEVESP